MVFYNLGSFDGPRNLQPVIDQEPINSSYDFFVCLSGPDKINSYPAHHLPVLQIYGNLYRERLINIRLYVCKN